MWLVLLALFDSALVLVDVGIRRKTLTSLGCEVPIGHRMADGHDLLAGGAQSADDGAAGLALAGSRADGADGDDRLGGLDLGALRSQQGEVGTIGKDL